MGKKYLIKYASQKDINQTGKCEMCHNWKVVRLCIIEPKKFKGDELHDRNW